MPRKGRKNDENSSSGVDSDPDFVVPRYSTNRFASSSRTSLHCVRRSTRTKRTRGTQAPMKTKIENGSFRRNRQNANRPRKESPKKMKDVKQTILSWLINSGTIEAGTRVQYRDGKVIKLEGKVSSDGILCSCCNCIITVKEFESHAGSNKHIPYINTCTGTGKSLLQCQIEAWDKQKMPACSGFQAVDIQKDDVDKNDDICNICGGDGQLTCCDICPLTYHENCVGIKTLPQVAFHCPICVCAICQIDGSKAPSFKCFQCEELLSRHRLSQRMECNSKVALAYAVYDECFKPIIDSRTGLDRIPIVVFNCGSNLSRLNCRGFYTFTLEKKDEVVAAASIRVHGTKLAEMPFIGTRVNYRHGGMCRRLVAAIVSVLLSLKVEKLVLPSASELVDYWKINFGFTDVSKIQRREMSSKNLMVFSDAILLQKILLLPDASNEENNEVLSLATLEDNNEPDNGGRDREEPPRLLPFDLNLEPPNEEVNMNNVEDDDKPSLGIFLTLDPDGSLHLKRYFADRPPVSLRRL
ncbi:hypothetical protein NE237_012469 [Protea cynaroides]|uniref:PHD-type domain-containing protein n=1 Tax=Protea cynaroides TaxID=273540 RepID=A0A9Q0GWU8_9MAGN|nr:hypothetical protein NE237_012469 [Protea cynaroides]